MKRSLYILPLVAGLSACGGSGSDDTIVTPPTPTPLAKVISGELTKISLETSTLTINKQEVNVSGATINPVPSRTQPSLALANLKVGMQLTISSDAKTIIFDSLMTAPVSNIDSDNNLMIAGMKVLTKNAELDGVKLDKNIIGKFVEISGYAIDGNIIQATYIEREDDDQKTELEGLVTELKGNSFKLGKVTVTASLSELKGIKQGDWVEVEGKLTEINDEFTLEATDVELDNPDYDDLLGKDNELEVEGIISWVSPNKDHLVINQNRSVAISSATKFEDGDINSLKPGANIEVEGTWDLDAANIKASKIEFDDADDNVTGIESAEFEVPGYAIYNATSNEITINGFPLIASSNIQFDDVLPSQVNGKQWVELSGYIQNDQFIVVEIEDSELDKNVEIEGVVKTFDGAKSLFNYKASDDSLDKYEDEQRVEVKCTLGANNEISQCQLENDDDND